MVGFHIHALLTESVARRASISTGSHCGFIQAVIGLISAALIPAV